MNQKKYQEILLNLLNKSKFQGTSFGNLEKMLRDDDLVKCDYISRPGEPNLHKISSISETAYQRAIFLNKTSTLQLAGGKTEIVTWVDLELPIELSKNSRRRCVDLVGIRNNIPFLCELKFSTKGNGDRPEYGIFEILIYYYLACCNAKELDENDIHHQSESDEIGHFTWQHLEQKVPMLILAANKSYWYNWFDKQTYRPDKTIDKILELVEQLNGELGTNLILFSTDDKDFKKQKGNRKKYCPSIADTCWTEISERFDSN